MPLEFKIWYSSGKENLNQDDMTAMIKSALTGGNVGHMSLKLMMYRENPDELIEIQNKYPELKAAFTPAQPLPQSKKNPKVTELPKTTSLPNVKAPPKEFVRGDYLAGKLIGGIAITNSFWPAVGLGRKAMIASFFGGGKVKAKFGASRSDMITEANVGAASEQNEIPSIFHPKSEELQNEILKRSEDEKNINRSIKQLQEDTNTVKEQIEKVASSSKPNLITLTYNQPALRKSLKKNKNDPMQIAAGIEINEEENKKLEDILVKNLIDLKAKIASITPDAAELIDEYMNKRNQLDSVYHDSYGTSDIRKELVLIQRKILLVIDQAKIADADVKDQLLASIAVQKALYYKGKLIEIGKKNERLSKNLKLVVQASKDLENKLINTQQTIGKEPDEIFSVSTSESGKNFFIDENLVLEHMAKIRKTARYDMCGENCARSVKNCIIAGINDDMKIAILNLKDDKGENKVPVDFFETKFDIPTSVRDWIFQLNKYIDEINYDYEKKHGLNYAVSPTQDIENSTEVDILDDDISKGLQGVLNLMNEHEFLRKEIDIDTFKKLAENYHPGNATQGDLDKIMGVSICINMFAKDNKLDEAELKTLSLLHTLIVNLMAEISKSLSPSNDTLLTSRPITISNLSEQIFWQIRKSSTSSAYNVSTSRYYEQDKIRQALDGINDLLSEPALPEEIKSNLRHSVRNVVEDIRLKLNLPDVLEEYENDFHRDITKMLTNLITQTKAGNQVLVKQQLTELHDKLMEPVLKNDDLLHAIEKATPSKNKFVAHLVDIKEQLDKYTDQFIKTLDQPTKEAFLAAKNMIDSLFSAYSIRYQKNVLNENEDDNELRTYVLLRRTRDVEELIDDFKTDTGWFDNLEEERKEYDVEFKKVKDKEASLLDERLKDVLAPAITDVLKNPENLITKNEDINLLKTIAHDSNIMTEPDMLLAKMEQQRKEKLFIDKEVNQNKKNPIREKQQEERKFSIAEHKAQRKATERREGLFYHRHNPKLSKVTRKDRKQAEREKIIIAKKR